MQVLIEKELLIKLAGVVLLNIPDEAEIALDALRAYSAPVKASPSPVSYDKGIKSLPVKTKGPAKGSKLTEAQKSAKRAKRAANKLAKQAAGAALNGVTSPVVGTAPAPLPV